MSSKLLYEASNSAMVPERLQHVYWIGGGSGGGKSTIARRLAAQHGFRVYATDEVMADHARRSTPEYSPLLHNFIGMNMDERWVDRSPKTMLGTFPWFQGECFEMIVEDLLSLPRGRGVVVEGFRLLPRLVKPLLPPANRPLGAERGRAVWLLPTPAFREAVIENRGGPAWGFLAKTSDPQRALHNLLERDRLFTEVLREETVRAGLPAIEVDGTIAEDELVTRVTHLYGL